MHDALNICGLTDAERQLTKLYISYLLLKNL